MNMTPPDDRRNLVLVYVPDQLNPADFREIGAAVRRRRPDIETIVMNAERPDPHAVKKAARRPSLIVSQGNLLNFRPQRGKIYAGKSVNKASRLFRLAQSCCS